MGLGHWLPLELHVYYNQTCISDAITVRVPSKLHEADAEILFIFGQNINQLKSWGMIVTDSYIIEGFSRKFWIFKLGKVEVG